MSLSSWTNMVGNFTRKEYRETRQTGQYYGNYNVDERIGYESATVEESRKPPNYPAHGMNSNYSRSVRKVVTDEPAWMRKQTWQKDSGMYRVKQDGYEQTVNLKYQFWISVNHGVGSYKTSDPAAGNTYNRSITSALEDLNSHAGVGTNVGQARQTGSELGHLASMLARALIAFRKRNIEDFLAAFGLSESAIRRSRGKTLAELWLMYMYGIKPLLSDIYETDKVCRQELNKGSQVFGNGRAHSSFDEKFDYISGGKTYQHVGSCKTSCQTRLQAEIDNPLLYKMNSLGLLNPAAIAWELVPWSFVVDWFMPVGATLEALTAGCGLRAATGFTTTQVNDRIGIHMKVDPYGNWGTFMDTSGNYDEVGFSFTRFCHASLPMPRLYANLQPYSTTRALNALALVRQLT